MTEQDTVNVKKRTGGGNPRPSKVRDSNIELFRIITMLMIVAYHYVVNSGLAEASGPIYADPLSWRSLFLLVFLGSWGKIGINCFVMITGYFMCKSNITAKKFAKLVLEVMFYRIVLHFIFIITGYTEFSVKNLIMTLIPVTAIDKGFTSCFFMFYLCIPFLNVLVNKMNEKQHIYLLLLCGFLYVVLGTFHRINFNYVSWFIVLYFIASYIRLYPKKCFSNTKLWGLLALLFIVISAASVVAGAWLADRRGFFKATFFVTDSNTFLAVAVGVCSFMFFKNVKIGYSKVINTIAASTFGVLCIHANSNTMRRWLWKDLLDNVGHYGARLMPLYAIGCVAAIFVVCIIIDILRINLLEKPFFKAWDKRWDSFSEKFKKCERKALDKMGVSN
ncbi:MAG: acyltransferase [Clostridia bacterium]|nr:acyltransferase [Clostridia bacterium]